MDALRTMILSLTELSLPTWLMMYNKGCVCCVIELRPFMYHARVV